MHADECEQEVAGQFVDFRQRALLAVFFPFVFVVFVMSSVAVAYFAFGALRRGGALRQLGPKAERAALIHRNAGSDNRQQAERYAEHQQVADRRMGRQALEFQAFEIRIEAHQAGLSLTAQGPEEAQDDHTGDTIAEPGMVRVDLAGEVGRDGEDGEQRVIQAHAVHDIHHGDLGFEDASGEDAQSGIGERGPASIRSLPRLSRVSAPSCHSFDFRVT